MNKHDELVRRLQLRIRKHHTVKDALELDIAEAAAAIGELEAELAKKNEELEYARAGIGYAEAAKLLETVDSLTADLAYATETWLDEETGTTWTVPTAWAYAQVCKANQKTRADLAAAELAKHKATP